MSALSMTATPQGTDVLLGSQLLVRDASELKARLQPALERGLPVRLHVQQLERIDTAALQLLLAFVLEAGARGIAVQWCGSNQSLERAIDCLGLGSALGKTCAR